MLATNTEFWSFLGVDLGLELKDLLNAMLDPSADARCDIEEVLWHTALELFPVS